MTEIPIQPSNTDSKYPVAWTMDLPGALTEEFCERAMDIASGLSPSHSFEDYTAQQMVALCVYASRGDAHHIAKADGADPSDFNNLDEDYVYLIDKNGSHALLEISRDGARMRLRPLRDWIG